jgi:membrane protein
MKGVSSLSTQNSFLKELVCRFFARRITFAASALTYTTLLALVPLMTVGITVLAALPVFTNIQEKVQHFIFSNFIPSSGSVIEQYFSGFAAQAKNLPVIGMVFIFVMAILLMLTIEKALNDIWQIKQKRKGWAALLRYIAILIFGPALLGVSLAATTYVVSLPFIKDVTTGTLLGLGLVDAIPFVLSLIGFTWLYAVMPNCKVSWRAAFIGALTASIIIQVAKHLFVFYFAYVKTYDLLYGALAIIPIFLIWIYVSWVIVLFGALVSNVVSDRKGFCKAK